MRLHPFAVRAARREAALELSKRSDISYRKALQLVEQVDADEIGEGLTDLAASDPDVAFALSRAGALEGVGGLGDGTILKAILDFFKNNPELVAALVKVILMLLAV